MNFFEHQEKARRRTNLLVALFALAVLLIGLAIYAAVIVGMHGAAYKNALDVGAEIPELVWWNPRVFALTMAGTLGFIALASLFQIARLGAGGSAVAKMMGGRPVDPNTTDAGERRLINVVEEMAIASGVPVPEIFVLDAEQGINAFAAGMSPQRAAVAVTRGALESFDRDQLQGVVAHEFSHIFNGDMRLNCRLMGVLFGILALAVIGRIVLSWGRFSRRTWAAAFATGLFLLILGYVGVLIGRLIQSAVSRQREFLADSSAVQFTRNPNGIAGALETIAGHASGSALASPRTGEVGHLLFGSGSRPSFFGRMLATHPPVDERVRRIVGSRPSSARKRPAVAEAGATGEAAPLAPIAAGLAGAAVSGFGGGTVTSTPAAVVDRVGRLGEEELAHGARLVAALSPALRRAVRTPERAQWAVYALLLDADPGQRQGQLAIIEARSGAAAAQGVDSLRVEVEPLGAEGRLPLADLAMPSLRRLETADVAAFLGVVDELVQADGKVTLFEFSLRWLLRHRLRAAREGAVAYKSVDKVAVQIAHLLGGLARAGNRGDREAASRAFRCGIDHVPTALRSKLVMAHDAGKLGGAADVGKALDRLVLASFPVKQVVVEAAARCAFEDQVVTAGEAELLRLLTISMGCPLPPFVADTVA